jgi:hypothetical protein
VTPEGALVLALVQVRAPHRLGPAEAGLEARLKGGRRLGFGGSSGFGLGYGRPGRLGLGFGRASGLGLAVVLFGVAFLLDVGADLFAVLDAFQDRVRSFGQIFPAGLAAEPDLEVFFVRLK